MKKKQEDWINMLSKINWTKFWQKHFKFWRRNVTLMVAGKKKLTNKLIKHIKKRIKNWCEIAGISRDNEPDCVILELQTLMQTLTDWQKEEIKKIS